MSAKKRLVIELEVVAVRDQMPDCDETVQLFSKRWNDDACTVLGWWDGEYWRDLQSMALTGKDTPTHWAKLPCLADAKGGEA